MTDEMNIQQKHRERLNALSEIRRKLLGMPAEKALDEILDSPQATAIVHSFAEEDFYFLMHDIGVEDALPLLSLASNKQWQYVLDLEVWEKDRPVIADLTKWFDWLLQADAERFVHWLQTDQTDVLLYYLFKGLEIRVREHDQDPSEFGENFYTFEDVYYFRFLKHHSDPWQPVPESESERELRESIIIKLLRRIAETDHFKYQSILLESASLIAAEMEEELFRFRNVRLIEKGFQPYDEALALYQPLDAEALIRSGGKMIDTTAETAFLPKPLYAAGMLMDGGIFADALKSISSETVLDQLQQEFAGLCNTIIAADQVKVCEKETLNAVVKRAAGYLGIGLEILAEKSRSSSFDTKAEFIRRHALMDVYRVGYGQAVRLKWKVEKWRKTSWCFNRQLPLSFWDEDGLGVLGGLLLKRPLFYDNYKTGNLYREFSTLADLERTAAAVETIIGLDDLFSLLDVPVKPQTAVPFTYKNVLLTLWARCQIGAEEKLAPITIDQFRSFFILLWEDDTLPRKIGLKAKALFLSWLCRWSHLTEAEINERLGNALEALFTDIEKEFENVTVAHLDPRYINLFLIAPLSVKKTNH